MQNMPLLKMPSRKDVHEKLIALAFERISPYEAERWALPYNVDDHLYEPVTDYIVWEGLGDLFGADWIYDFDPVYDQIDYQIMLKHYEDSCILSPLKENNYEFEPTQMDMDFSDNPNTLPSYGEVREKFHALTLKDNMWHSRVSHWAMPWIYKLEHGIIITQDTLLHDALTKLYRSNMPSVESSRKYDLDDFDQWLKDFDQLCTQNNNQSL